MSLFKVVDSFTILLLMALGKVRSSFRLMTSFAKETLFLATVLESGFCWAVLLLLRVSTALLHLCNLSTWTLGCCYFEW